MVASINGAGGTGQYEAAHVKNLLRPITELGSRVDPCWRYHIHDRRYFIGLEVNELTIPPTWIHRFFLHIVSDRVCMILFLFGQSSSDALRICRFYVDDRSTCKQESSPPTFSGSLNYNTRDHCTATLPKLQSIYVNLHVLRRCYPWHNMILTLIFVLFFVEWNPGLFQTIMGFWQCSNMKQHFHFWRFWWFLGSPKATPHMNRWLVTVYGIGAEKLRFEATRNISSWDPFIASPCPSSCKSERIPMIHDDSFFGKIGRTCWKDRPQSRCWDYPMVPLFYSRWPSKMGWFIDVLGSVRNARDLESQRIHQSWCKWVLFVVKIRSKDQIWNQTW